MRLDEIVVDANTEILDALTKIDKNGRQILYVTNTEGILVGGVTDGDVRRYILAKQSILGTVSDVMNKNVKFLWAENMQTPAEYMRNLKITSVPIVDKQKRVIAVEFLDGDKIYSNKNLGIPVVIMAGGKGSRLYPYTQILPKPLIPVGEKAIIERIMDNFERFGCDDFHVIVNYKKEFIKAFFMESENKRKISFVDEKEFGGTAGGLKLIQGSVKTTFFMSNCDVLVNTDYGAILKYHKESKNVLTMVCAVKKEAIPYGVIKTFENGGVKKIEEKPQLELLVNTGVYLAEPEFLEEIPEQGICHMTDVIQKCIETNKNIGVFPVSEDAWMDMGQLEELEKMKSRLNV